MKRAKYHTLLFSGLGVKHLGTAIMLIVASLLIHSFTPGTAVIKSVKIILDTDIGPDVDDAGTIALLHGLSNLKEAEILGIVCNTTSEWGAPCIDAINTYYGRPGILVGTLKGEGSSGDEPEWSGFSYNHYIAQHFPNRIKNGKNASDAVTVYRKALAKQPDTSVVIVSVGALTNLRNLLNSPPDAITKLNGLALITKKVKFLSLMAGSYPKGVRKDPNFSMDIQSSMEVLAKWPTSIILSGEEVGKEIKTGTALFTQTPKENPVREAYLQWDAHFRTKWDSTFKAGVSIQPHDSYDQTSVLFAVRGAGNYWKISSRGTVSLNENGYCQWQENSKGKHRYLIQWMEPSEIAKVIDSLMIMPPQERK